jgi:exonuclease SbcC
MITSIRLKNVGPYSDRTFRFGPGLTVIVGKNGSGKSTIVNSAYAALTNDFSRLRVAQKTHIISSFADEVERSFIEIEGEIGGESFTLRRSLRPNKNTLSVGDEMSYKSEDIETRICKLFGLTKQMLGHYVFVEQGKMFEFLTASDAERNKTFQAMCGVDATLDIYKACSNFLAQNRQKTVVDNSEAVKVYLSKTNVRLKQIAQELSTLDTSAFSAETVSKHRKIVEAYNIRESWSRARRAYLRMKNQEEVFLKRLVAKYGKTQKNVNALKSQLEEMVSGADLEDIKSKASESQRDARRKVLGVVNNARSYAKKFKTLLKNFPAIPNTSNLKEKIQELELRIRQLKSEIVSWEELAKAGKDLKTCPVCQQVIEEKYLAIGMKKLEILKQEFSNDKSAQTKLKRRLIFAQKAIKRRKDLRQKLKDYNNQVSEGNKKLLDFPTEEQFITARDFLRAYENLKSKFAEERSSLANLTSQIESSTQKLKEAENFSTSEEPPEISLKMFSASKDALEVAEALRVKCSSIKAEQKLLLEQKTNLEKNLEKMSEMSSLVFKQNKLLGVVENVSKVFHWRALPQFVLRRILEKLGVFIEENLKVFNSPFTVVPEDDLTFSVGFPNGITVKSRQLSPGQLVVLSLAIRMAVNQIFRNPILFLDEPTINLDEDNVTFLQQALGSASDLASKQLVIVTHDYRFASAAKSVIDLDGECTDVNKSSGGGVIS